MPVRKLAADLLARGEHFAARHPEAQARLRDFGRRLPPGAVWLCPYPLEHSLRLATSATRITRRELATLTGISYSIAVGDPIHITPGQPADYLRVFDDIILSERAGARLIHVDVVDDVFAAAQQTNSFGPFTVGSRESLPEELCKFLAAARRSTTLPLEVHLMVGNPQDYIAKLAAAGVDIITLSGESNNVSNHPKHETAATLRAINQYGIHAGLAINPNTPLHYIMPFSPLLSLLTIMGVTPGKSGQKLQAWVGSKVADARKIITNLGYVLGLQVDGGVSYKTIESLRQANLRVSASVVGREANLQQRTAVVRQLSISPTR
jgi:ribulose-phosphate 3-epimerase